MSAQLELAIREVVIANRVLAHEGICDAYGHVSVRHPHYPERYLLSWSRSPELVEIGDIVEYALDGTPIKDDRPGYKERRIHGGIYEARSDVNVVVHAHPEDVLPFSASTTPLRPIVGNAAIIGAQVPVWDIADHFGDETNLLVENMEHARDLARCLGKNSLALMRGHGMTVAAGSVLEALRISIFAPRNARAQLAAIQLGEPKYLSAGELKVRAVDPYFSNASHGTYRAWEYWARRAGCADMLSERSQDTMKDILR